MKNVILFLTAILIISFTACSTEKEQQGPVENKKRPVSPSIEKITTYKTSPEDSIGTILKEIHYNEAGQQVKFIGYDYYGSGEVEDITDYKYDAKGKVIEEKTGKKITTYAYTYNEKDQLIALVTKRGKSGGGKEEYIYNEQGDKIEIKYYDKKGKYDFSRVFKFIYDTKGNIKEEWKWEKYTDGSADLEMYHILMKYDDLNRVVEKVDRNPIGEFNHSKVYKFDRAGNQIEIVEYDDNPDIASGKNLIQYNEYGEMIKDEGFHCDKKGEISTCWATTTYIYDSYGNQLSNMMDQKDGEDFGERRVIAYREVKK